MKPKMVVPMHNMFLITFINSILLISCVML
jgi:hypothetical protein